MFDPNENANPNGTANPNGNIGPSVTPVIPVSASSAPSMGIGMGVVMGAGDADMSGMMGMMGMMGAMSMMNANGANNGGASALGGNLILPDGTPAPTIEPVLPAGFWQCKKCRKVNNGKFCVECGSPRE